MQHHYGVFLHRRNAGDQVVLAVRQAQGAAVGIGADETFRQARKHYGYIGVHRRRYRPQKFALVPLVPVGGKALHIPHAAAFQQRGVQRTDGRGAGLALAIIARGLGKRADVRHPLPGPERQCAQILHQHAALCGQLHRQRVGGCGRRCIVGFGGGLRQKRGGGLGQGYAVQRAAAVPHPLRPGLQGRCGGRQVDLLQCALIYATVRGVGDLAAAQQRPHHGILRAAHNRCRQRGGQVRVLAEHGKIAAAQRAALDVGVDLRLPLRRAHAARQGRIKAGRHGTRRRQHHTRLLLNGHRNNAPFFGILFIIAHKTW